MKAPNESNLRAIGKILIIQFRPFGDVLLASAYIKALHERFPDADIDFLVKKPYDAVLANHPYLARVLAFEQTRGVQYVADRVGLFQKIRQQRYDLVIDQQHGTGSAQVVLSSGARYKLGWSHGKWRWIYNLKAVRGPDRYSAVRNFDMLTPLGIVEKTPEFFFHIEPAADAFVTAWLRDQGLISRRMLFLAPGSPRSKKKWHPARYAGLTDLILEKTQMPVVLLHGPNEVTDCRRVMALSRHEPVLGPETTFQQAAALLKRGHMLVCNDGGMNHLAVALGVPSLAIFGNTPPAIWSPQGYFPHHRHLYNPEWERRPENDYGISATQAFAAVREMLAEIPDRRFCNRF